MSQCSTPRLRTSAVDCRRIGIFSAIASDSASGQMIDGAEESGVEEATRFADDLLAGKGDTLAILKSIPKPTPKPLPSVVQLVKRLQSMLRESGEKEAATAEKRTSTFINWERLLDDIEPYLYGSTPMCQALRSSGRSSWAAGSSPWAGLGRLFPSGPRCGPMGPRYKRMWLASRPNIV